MPLNQKRASVQVWDLAVRCFHWSLPVALIIEFATEEGPESLHLQTGYLVLALVLFRLLWGFVGSRYARFGSFVTPPTAVVDYLKKFANGSQSRYLGHNPAGGLMVILLLASLLVTSLSGLMEYNSGRETLENTSLLILVDPAFENKNNTTETLWSEIHEVLSGLTLALVFFHVLGVVVTSLLHQENLIDPMLTGANLWHRRTP